MRKILILVSLFLVVALVVFSFSELETIVLTLQHARMRYFLLGVFIQLCWFLVLGKMYQSIYRLLALDESVINLSRIATAANFINVIAPTAGMGGVALFAAEARRRGHLPGRATVAAALFFLFDQAAFLFILALAFMILFRRNDLSAGEITAAILLLTIFFAYAFLLYLGYRSEARLGDVLARLAGWINRLSRIFFHRDYLSRTRAHEFAHEISEGLGGLTQKPGSLLLPVLWGLVNKSLLMGILLCAFLSFGVPFSIGTIVAGFALAYLFYLVSPTPSGLGIVEGLMPVALSSLRVDWSQAVVVTLTYRAITFWLPLGIGAWTFRSLHTADSPNLEA